MTGLCGSPPQVTVRTRSGRNQIRYSPCAPASGIAEIGVASTPVATAAKGAKAGASRPSATLAYDLIVRLAVEPSGDFANLSASPGHRPR